MRIETGAVGVPVIEMIGANPVRIAAVEADVEVARSRTVEIATFVFFHLWQAPLKETGTQTTPSILGAQLIADIWFVTWSSSDERVTQGISDNRMGFVLSAHTAASFCLAGAREFLIWRAFLRFLQQSRAQVFPIFVRFPRSGESH